MNKKEMRKKILTMRDAMTKEDVVDKSSKICVKLGEYLLKDEIKTVMVYIPTGNEVDILSFIRRLLNEGKRVVAPICVEIGVMVPSLVEDLEKDLAPGRYDILAPKEKRPVPIEELDAVIVPGASFDSKGNRLGFGAGYYDRFLPQVREDAKKIAVCYDYQFAKDGLEVDPWDCPVDMVMTESATYLVD